MYLETPWSTCLPLTCWEVFQTTWWGTLIRSLLVLLLAQPEMWPSMSTPWPRNCRVSCRLMPVQFVMRPCEARRGVSPR
jgi:hypothetical protein